MNSFPTSLDGGLGLGLILLGMVLLYFLLFNAVNGQKRRLLQNLIYWGYWFLGWLDSFWSALDAGLLHYYRRRKKWSISPLSEKEFPPTSIPKKMSSRKEEAEEAALL